MAKLHKMFTMTALCFAVSALPFSPTLAEEGDDDYYSPGPISDDVDVNVLSIGPSADIDPFLDQCLNNLSGECSNEIFNVMFMEDMETISEPCCTKLVRTGKECHEGLVMMLLLQIPGTRAQIFKALSMSEQIWSDCASQAASSSSPI